MMPTLDAATKKKVIILVALLVVLGVCLVFWKNQASYRRNTSTIRRLGESSYQSDPRDLPGHQTNAPGQVVVLNIKKTSSFLSANEQVLLQKTLLKTFYADVSLTPSLASIEGKISENDAGNFTFNVVTDIDPEQEYTITTTSAGRVTNVRKKE